MSSLHGSTFVEGSTSTIVDDQATFVDIMAKRVRARANERGATPAVLSRFLSVPTSTMDNYWKGKRPWPVELLSPLAELLGFDPGELLTGKKPTPTLGAGAMEDLRRSLAASDKLNMKAELVDLAEVDLAYGLGGSYADGELEVTTHRFPQALLQKLTRTPAGEVTLASGRGDSMEPTIHDGDWLMIDRSQRSVREQDALWALTVGEIAMVKRLRVFGERVILLSDNDRVPAAEYHHEEVNIVGRVFFIGRRV